MSDALNVPPVVADVLRTMDWIRNHTMIVLVRAEDQERIEQAVRDLGVFMVEVRRDELGIVKQGQMILFHPLGVAGDRTSPRADSAPGKLGAWLLPVPFVRLSSRPVVPWLPRIPSRSLLAVSK